MAFGLSGGDESGTGSCHVGDLGMHGFTFGYPSHISICNT